MLSKSSLGLLLSAVLLSQTACARTPVKHNKLVTEEKRPTDEPKSLRVREFHGNTAATLDWLPVPNQSVRGILKGYIVITWTAGMYSSASQETIVRGNLTEAFVQGLNPFRMNYAQVLVFNGRHKGPPGEPISFFIPDELPERVEFLDVYPLGRNAVLMRWKKSENEHDIGFQIHYTTLNENLTEIENLNVLEIHDKTTRSAKLGHLEPNTDYKIYIATRSRTGLSMDTPSAEVTTLLGEAEVPDVPDFTWRLIASQDGQAKIRIQWKPDILRSPGASFFAEYKRGGSNVWHQTPHELEKDFQIFDKLSLNTPYEFRVVSVDGQFSTKSAARLVMIPDEYTVTRSRASLTSGRYESKFYARNNSTRILCMKWYVFIALFLVRRVY